MMDWGMGGGVMMVIFWGLILALAIGLVRVLFPEGPRAGSDGGETPDDPLVALKRRYAAGELSSAGYELQRAALVTGSETESSKTAETDEGASDVVRT